MKKILKNNKGFTLIEMLVVVLIIGILAAVALPQYKKAVEKTYLTNAIARMEAIEKYIQLYYAQHEGSIPDFVQFLGDKNDVPDYVTLVDLDVDFTAGLTCVGNMDDYCYDGHFGYRAYGSPEGYSIDGFRIDTNGNWLYLLGIYRDYDYGDYWKEYVPWEGRLPVLLCKSSLPSGWRCAD